MIIPFEYLVKGMKVIWSFFFSFFLFLCVLHYEFQWSRQLMYCCRENGAIFIILFYKSSRLIDLGQDCLWGLLDPFKETYTYPDPQSHILAFTLKPTRTHRHARKLTHKYAHAHPPPPHTHTLSCTKGIDFLCNSIFIIFWDM